MIGLGDVQQGSTAGTEGGYWGPSAVVTAPPPGVQSSQDSNSNSIFNLPLIGPYLSPSGSSFIAEQPIITAMNQQMGTTTRGLSTSTWIAIGFAGLVAIMIFGKR